jgi:hypothetical protein
VLIEEIVALLAERRVRIPSDVVNMPGDQAKMSDEE